MTSGDVVALPQRFDIALINDRKNRSTSNTESA
jgi:hypothetical protein